MAEVSRINDAGDDRLDAYRELRDADLRRRDGLFIVEGPLAVRRLVASPYAGCTRSVVLSERQLPAQRDLVASLPGHVAVYVVGQSVLHALVGFDLHRGVVAAAARPPEAPFQALLQTEPRPRRIAVLERVNDHENLGVIFRAAAGLGWDAILLDPETADPLYRRSIRVSMGHVLDVPFARLSPWPASLGAVTAAGFTMIALTPGAATPLKEVDLPGGRPVALLLGSEGHGLSAAALETAGMRVGIPMAAHVDSLNIGAAAAVAFHHLQDVQRHGAGE